MTSSRDLLNFGALKLNTQVETTSQLQMMFTTLHWTLLFALLSDWTLKKHNW